MNPIAKEFIDHLEKVFDACTEIQDAGGCSKCPISHNCIDETTVSEFANFCTKGKLDEFLGFAKDCEEYGYEVMR